MAQMKRKMLLAFAVMLAWKLMNPACLAVVQGSSMEPTLRDGQMFVIDRVSYRMKPIASGDVVALYHEGEILVKRIAGMGGDTVWLLREHMTENSEFVPQGRLERVRKMVAAHPDRGYLERRTVPPGQMFIVGDHSEVSYDSRDFGTVPVDSVIGRARW